VTWLGSAIRTQTIITGEQLPEMLVDGPHLAVERSVLALRLTFLIDKGVQGPFKRLLATGAIHAARPGDQLISRRTAVGHDERNPAGPGLGRNHAKCLRFAAMNQRIGAGEKPRQLVPVTQMR